MAETSVRLSDGHTVRTAIVGDLSPADFERWRGLDARALEPRPYLSADYLQPAVPHWPAGASIRLVIVERDDQMQMIMPFRVMPLHSRLPIHMLSTWEPTLADETSGLFPVLAADGGAEAFRAAFTALAALGLPRLVDIVTIAPDGPTCQLIRTALPTTRCYIRGRSQWPAARIPSHLSSGPSSDLDMVPHHRSRSTQKKARQAWRALEHTFDAQLAARDRSEDPLVIEDFLTLQAAGWKGDASRRGVAYQITGRAPWLHEVAARFRSKGQFAAFEIHADGRPVYLSLDFRIGSTLLALQDAYDEAGAPHGLGNLARTAHLNWLAGRGTDTYDPNMFWGYIESARFYPDRSEKLRLLLAAPGRAAYLQLAAIRGAKHAVDRARDFRESAVQFIRERRGADRGRAEPSAGAG